MSVISSSDQSNIVLVAGCDENFAMPLGVTLFSLLKHLSPHASLVLYIIDSGISDVSKRHLENILLNAGIPFELHWYTPEMYHGSSIKKRPDLTPSKYYKILSPEIVDSKYEKAIFLDCDTLVEHDICTLWEEEMGGFAALAVQDYGTPYLGSSGGGLKQLTAENLDLSAPYFNAGILVLNLTKWRNESLAELSTSFMNTYFDSWSLGDQPALNAVLSRRWGILDPRWNVQFNIYLYDFWKATPFKRDIGANVQQIRDQGYIYHFTGTEKPWKPKSRHPMNDKWLSYLKESGCWKEKRQELEDFRKSYSVVSQPGASKKKLASQILPYIEPGEHFFLIDGEIWVEEDIAGRHAHPFPENQGEYWGLPSDNQTAIRELDKMTHKAISLIVFTRAAFWWFDFYTQFYQHLRKSSRCILHNEEVAIFRTNGSFTQAS